MIQSKFGMNNSFLYGATFGYMAVKSFGSSSNQLYPQSVGDEVSKWSEDTSDKGIKEISNNSATKISEYVDKYSEESIINKRLEWEKLDKNEAKFEYDKLVLEIKTDNAKVSEELREDSSKVISIIKNSTYTEESKTVLIEKEYEALVD